MLPVETNVLMVKAMDSHGELKLKRTDKQVHLQRVWKPTFCPE